jgi:hypothetical protein
MTTITQIHHCSTALARHGDRLPNTERDAWRRFDSQLLDPQLHAVADQEWASLPAWYVPAGYAEQVWALCAASVAATAPALATRWLAGWLTEHTERATPTLVQARAALMSAGGLAPERALSWTVLRISGVMLTTEADHWRVAAINNAAELTCADIDGRPWEWRDDIDGQSWQWRDNGFQLEVHIGPPHASWRPSADQLADELAHLATGLDPGGWYIGTI